jgi:hypothetical protein
VEARRSWKYNIKICLNSIGWKFLEWIFQAYLVIAAMKPSLFAKSEDVFQLREEIVSL